MDQETAIRIKARVMQLETEIPTFIRDGNVVNRFANERAIIELNKILDNQHGYE